MTRARYEIKPFKRDFSPIKCAIYVYTLTGFSYNRYDGIVKGKGLRERRAMIERDGKKQTC